MNEQLEKDYLKVKELKEYLRIGRVNAYSLIHQEGFPLVKVGGCYRIPVKELSEWLKSQSITDRR